MSYDLVQTEDATVEPVTVDQAKAHARVETDKDDALFPTYIKAARKYCEKITGRAFIEQTWRLSLDHFPWCGYDRSLRSIVQREFYGAARWRIPEILVPRPKLIDVESITYLDLNGQRQTLDPNLWDFDADAQPARVFPLLGQTWPLALEQPGSVQVTFTCGYGQTAEAVPETLQLAILMLVAHWYENRESTVLPLSGTGIVGVPMGFAELIDAETFTAFTFES